MLSDEESDVERATRKSNGDAPAVDGGKEREDNIASGEHKADDEHKSREE